MHRVAADPIVTSFTFQTAEIVDTLADCAVMTDGKRVLRPCRDLAAAEFYFWLPQPPTSRRPSVSSLAEKPAGDGERTPTVGRQWLGWWRHSCWWRDRFRRGRLPDTRRRSRRWRLGRSDRCWSHGLHQPCRCLGPDMLGSAGRALHPHDDRLQLLESFAIALHAGRDFPPRPRAVHRNEATHGEPLRAASALF